MSCTRLKNPPIYGDCTLVSNTQDPALPFWCILNFTWLPIKNLRLFLPSKTVPILCTQLALCYKCCNRDTAYSLGFFQCFEIEVQHSATKAFELPRFNFNYITLKPLEKVASIIRILASSGNGSANINQIRTKCIWNHHFLKNKQTTKPPQTQNTGMCWRS